MQALTTKEVVALFGLDERRVRKEVEHGILDVTSPPQFDLAAVVYLRALFELGFELGGVDDRKRLYSLILRAMQRSKPPATVALSPIVELKLGSIVRYVKDRSTRFQRWRKRIVVDERVLGGEPVFPKSRLAVRNVGGLLLRGNSLDDIRGDYPYLTDEDLEFARMFAVAYPRLGRPRERQAAAR